MTNFLNMKKRRFKWVVAITLLPILAWPLTMIGPSHQVNGTERFLILAMPVYAVASAYLANYVYKDRPELAWILIALNWLSYAAFIVLVYVM